MRYFLLRMKRFCGYAVGFVFFISGILKLMDPVGSGLVMQEYFRFLHIGFLDFAAKPAGALLALAEAIAGAGLITGVWRRLTGIAVLAMQGMFTLLTLLLVIFKPEMDCGCFGEAVHLTHGETFIENIVLLVLLLIYYIPKRHLGETRRRKYVSFAVVAVSSAAFGLYSWLYIPMADFTDFRPGTVLGESGIPQEDLYESAFIYEKDGHQEEFSLDNLPDSTWTFVSTRTTLKEGAEEVSPIISIYDPEGNYADSLLTEGRVMAVSVYRESLTQKELRHIECFITNARKAGFRTVLLSAHPEGNLPADRYNADYKTLITLNRSNGGATYICDGHIIRKWAEKTLPAPEELASLYEEDPTDTFIGRDTGTNLAFQGFLLYVFAVMLLL